MKPKIRARFIPMLLMIAVVADVSAATRMFEATFPAPPSGNPNFPVKANAKITVTNIRNGASGTGPGAPRTTGSAICVPNCGYYQALTLNSVVYTSGAGVVTLGAGGSGGAVVTFRVDD